MNYYLKDKFAETVKDKGLNYITVYLLNIIQ